MTLQIPWCFKLNRHDSSTTSGIISVFTCHKNTCSSGDHTAEITDQVTGHDGDRPPTRVLVSGDPGDQTSAPFVRRQKMTSLSHGLCWPSCYLHVSLVNLSSGREKWHLGVSVFLLNFSVVWCLTIKILNPYVLVSTKSPCYCYFICIFWCKLYTVVLLQQYKHQNVLLLKMNWFRLFYV